MKILAFIGYHNSGKTTLIEFIARALKEKGYKVGYIKHDPKGHAQVDKEGSDTFRMKSILTRVLLSSPKGVVLWSEEEDDPLKLSEKYFSDFDLVIVEGYKNHPSIPKIGVGERFEAPNVILWVENPKRWEEALKVIEGLIKE